MLAEHDANSQAQLLFVIDAVNCSLADVTRSEEAVVAFLRQGSGALLQPTTVLILSDTAPQSKTSTPSQGNDTTALNKRQLFVHRLSTTINGNALAKELDDYKIGFNRILEAQGADAVSERVRLSLEALSFIATAEANMPGAKVTVWLSPGWPFLARSEAKSSEQFFDSVVYFSDALRTARMILYMINPQGITNQDNSAQTEAFLLASRPGSIQAGGHAPNVPVELSEGYYKQFVKGVSTPKQSNANDLSLQVLAIQSGGFVTQQNNDLKGQIAKCAADVANLTAISYLPARTGGVTTYHDVQVKTVHPAQNLRTRTGFYSR